ncbi:MBL fold metallo-hydrolase [Leptolyngbya ohadii]|uniref:MBL fold metallo-hydrolase n=1 Tax=Leptolyngbya ohadii TaxID=1962290 RepID=UPI000B59FB7D|nr:MBL fold metallo-hydrolase [Leptolyngbya ohadii]
MSVVDPSARRTSLPLSSEQPFSSADGLTVRFWGVRGEVPTPGNDMVQYGGNTPCVELQAGQQRLIFDGGTGLRVLGKQLLQEMPTQAHLFFTHTHWDRIQGFPFFQPAYQEGNCFEIYGAIAQNGASIKQRLYDQMLRPNFPVPLQMMRSELRFHDIASGQKIAIEDEVEVEPLFLNRLTSALGYRISWKGHAIVYATDIEPSGEQVGQKLCYLAQGAELLILDVSSTDSGVSVSSGIDDSLDEMIQRQVALWSAGIEAATAAQVKQIVLFHYDPAYDDVILERIEAQTQAKFPQVKFAREGMVLPVV